MEKYYKKIMELIEGTCGYGVNGIIGEKNQVLPRAQMCINKMLHLGKYIQM